MNKKVTSKYLLACSLMFLGFGFVEGIFNEADRVNWIILIACIVASITLFIAANKVDKDDR